MKSLGRTFFSDTRIGGICPENPCQQLCFSVCHFLPTELSPSYFPHFPIRPRCPHFRPAPSQRSSPQAISHFFPSVHHIHASISLPPNRALPKPFPTISRLSTMYTLPSRSFPTELSPSYFPQFPLRPPCRRFRLAPSQRGALLKLFATVSPPSAISTLPSRSFPPELSPNDFPQFPLRPPCRRFRLGPSQRSSPRAISHGFPCVHPVVAFISLLPTELSPSDFPRFPIRPPYPRFHLAPSQQSSPQAISHGFCSVNPVVASISLSSNGALP